ncbi:hypothetical protein HDU92_002362 [Lobulomyces angularis]|nr:hypothetical protein HDU92_002362 [Lobulomyces angularis]
MLNTTDFEKGSIYPTQNANQHFLTEVSGRISLTIPNEYTCTGTKAEACGYGCLKNFTLTVKQPDANNTGYYTAEFGNFPYWFKNKGVECQCTNSFSLKNGDGDMETTGLTSWSSSWIISGQSNKKSAGNDNVYANCNYNFNPPHTIYGGLYCEIRTADNVTCNGTAAFLPFSSDGPFFYRSNGTANGEPLNIFYGQQPTKATLVYPEIIGPASIVIAKPKPVPTSAEDL